MRDFKIRLAAGAVLLFLSSLLLPAWLFGQRNDARLQKDIAALLTNLNGQAGVFVKNLRTGRTVAISEDSLFPTASMIKVSILTAVMAKLENGDLQYHQVLEYKDSLLYAGVDLLGSFKSGEKIELSKLMMLMLSMSDNTASLWLQTLAGGGTRINEILDSLGFIHTKVNSRTPGRETARQAYGWGQTTPKEMVSLFEKIYTGQLISRKASERMLRLLGRDYWDEYALSQIPPFVFAACKGGAVDASRSETVLVMAPHGSYIFSVATKNLGDTSWADNNEGWVLARKLSNLLWNYFEPGSGWQPSTNLEGKLD